jgi:K+-sensing histidine kinase KdpD
VQLDPDGVMTLAAVAACGAAPIIRPWARWTIQGLIVVAATVAAIGAGLPPARVAVAGVLLVGVVVVASTFAADLHRARDAEVGARAAAQRRAQLLGRLRQLPGRDVATASQAVIDALRSLGFDSAGVALRQGRVLEVVDLEGSAIPEGRIDEGEGLSWQAMTEQRTVVSDDYQRDPGRLPGREGVRSAIISPIPGPDEPLGVVLCSRRRPQRPSDAEIEAVEICAEHLGAVIATDRQLLRQRELLRRMHRLDSMRSGFVAEVSAELREQLVAARDATRVLARDHQRMPPDVRRRMIEELRVTTDELRETIDTLLDFSRFQREHRDDLEVMGATVLAQRLADLVDMRGTVDPATSPDVAADPALLGRALELLADAERPTVGIEADATGVRLTLEEPASLHPLVRSLAEQLAVSGGGEVESDTGSTIVVQRSDPDGDA